MVVAADGYPGRPRLGDVVTGAEGDGVLHAGTRRRDDGAVVSAGGRVLSVVGTGADLAAARDDAYRRLAGSSCRARTTATTSRCAPPRGRSRSRRPGDRPCAPRRRPCARGAQPVPSRVVGVSRSVARPSESARATIPPFHVMDVWAAAGERQRTHGDLINLSAGQPSTPAPRPVRTAAAAALEGDVLGYTVALGIPELRAGIAAHYGDMHGLAVDRAPRS